MNQNNPTPMVSPCLLTSAFTRLQNRICTNAKSIMLDGFDVEPELGMAERIGPRAIDQLVWMDCKSAAGYLKRLDKVIKVLDGLGYETHSIIHARDEYHENIKIRAQYNPSH